MVRNSELNAARRGAADKARARQQVRSQMTGTLVGIDPEDSRRVIVSFDGSEVSVLAGPDKLVPGSLVAVEVDALGAPVRVVGAVTVRPAGLDEDMPAPLPVVAMPELAARELTEAERLAIIETEQGLADARADLEDARAEAETNFGTLDEKLGQAFPTDIFDVGAALGAVEVDVLAQAALDAQGMATAAQEAAITAAQAFAAGEISEAELRAANDAQAKANAARDAAIEAAELDATSKAGQALTGAKTYAEQQAQAAQAAAALDAQAVALAAQQAAIEAAAEHADLVAAGANADAIAAAAVAAQAMADAAQAAAQAHADAQAAAAETAAKTHATNEAARVKQEALSEAATDALSKANAAASAAQTAAEQYALAQAEGKAGAALTAAKEHAEAQAQAAQEAAETAAVAHADAARNAAIDAAALTAQTKADVAKQGAIDAAKADLDALEVGGRNLILDSGRFIESQRYDVGYYDLAIPTVPGQTYTYQIKGTLPEGKTRFLFYARIGSPFGGTGPNEVYDGETGIYSQTFTANQEVDQITIYSYPNTVVGTTTIEWVKLERGSKATDWQPAPEDVDAGIAGAIDVAATDAQTKADAAASAAQSAAEAYALAQAQGLSGQALADAKADATAKAEAAQQAAITAAATDAQTKANKAKTDAISAAATDAQTKADAAASAAQQAAEAYALAQAQGLSGQALADAKADATAKANAAELAAKDAAAADALSKANAARDAAIQAAQSDLANLEIGGRNLIRDSGRFVENQQYLVTSYDLATTTVPGQKYTYQIKGTLPEGKIRFLFYSEEGIPFGAVSGNELYDEETGIYWQTFTANQEVDQIRIYSYPNMAATTTIEWVKLERGSKATDWQPAPEDVDAGIVDARTIATTADGKATTAQQAAATADGKAVTAQQAAAVADGKATTAQQAAAAADSRALAAGTAASQAMTTADGKNTTSYKNVTTTPGPAPTNEVEGKNRRQFDMHRNRLSDGTIVGEWMWSGTSWVQVHMGDGILRSLDVGKLSAGTANIETTVANKLWAGLAVVQRLQVEQSAYIDGVNLKDGAVTARTLNVVPASGTGGMELLPPGLRIIPSDAEAGTAVSLRTDEDNWISFAKAGKSMFSVNPDGHLTAQQVDAGTSLTYQGDELADLLSALPRGVIAHSSGRGNGSAIPGNDAGRIGAVTFRTPPDDRMVEVRFRGYIAAGSARDIDMWIRQSTGDFVRPTNSSKQFWRLSTNGYAPVEVSALMRTDTDGWGWTKDTTITVGLFAATVRAGEAVTFHQNGGNEITVTDMGPAVIVQPHTPWVPSTGGGTGGGNETQPGKRDYTYQRKSSWVRSFLGNNNYYNYGAGRAYQGLQPGTNNGNLKSMIGWPSLTSTLNGANIKSIKVRIKADHTYAYSGATAYIGLHSRTSAPATFALSASSVVSASFTRGQTRTLTIPSQYHAGFKSGSYTGIILYTNVESNARYGYWDGTNCELIIEYEK